ncbi:MAG: 30S ribosomal protein S16 [Anaerolineae bacterium]
MVRIRLRRMGLKKQPSYRIVVADQRSARTGGFIEAIGNHNPRTEPTTDIVDEGRALYWLSVGAQPTDAIVSIFKRTGTMDRFARLKAGESLEALVSEANAANAEAASVSPKTSRPAPAAGQSIKKAKEAAAKAEEGSAS